MQRSGSWHFHRAFFEDVFQREGAVAEAVMLYLVNNAVCSQTEVPLADKTTAILEEGDALVSLDSISNRIGRPRSTVRRAFQKLRNAGFFAVRQTGRRLERGKGTRPTIVNVTNFKRFRRPASVADSHGETWVGTIEENQLGRNHAVSQRSPVQEARNLASVPLDSARASQRGEVSGARAQPVASAEDFLREYERTVGNLGDVGSARRAVSAALAVVSPAYLGGALTGYAERLRLFPKMPRCNASEFFQTEYLQYLLPKARERAEASLGSL
jgi:biotin operon repressor